jgi:hypothetical protein
MLTLALVQREKLTAKTQHVLYMSATPIPRTLLLACYGDMDVSCGLSRHLVSPGPDEDHENLGADSAGEPAARGAPPGPQAVHLAVSPRPGTRGAGQGAEQGHGEPE